ncbi:antirestriction protein ArdA [Gordonia cholesterolivorans]|uniref:Antirestriction protein n=1 Tax=Gordonia cholesterolivorans TaxID=559625 RepID=A0ABN3HCG4_9ACTN
MTNAHEPAIWAGCMHHFNCGFLVGEWFSAVDADEITLAAVHRSGPAVTPECEEIWAYDIENFPEAKEMDLLEAARWGELYEEVGDDAWPAFCSWVASGSYVEGGDQMPSVSDFRERYRGTWEDWNAYVWGYIVDIDLHHDWPEDAVRFFDFERYAAEMAHDFTVEPAPGRCVYVFSDN